MEQLQLERKRNQTEVQELRQEIESLTRMFAHTVYIIQHIIYIYIIVSVVLPYYLYLWKSEILNRL